MQISAARYIGACNQIIQYIIIPTSMLYIITQRLRLPHSTHILPKSQTGHDVLSKMASVESRISLSWYDLASFGQ